MLSHPAAAPARHTGFSLIELMTVIVIIGILAAIAIPNYNRSVRRAERSDARAALAAAQAYQERAFFNRNSYLSATEFAAAWGTASTEGHYTIASANSGTCLVASCYILTATRSKVELDTECHQFSLSSNGTRESKQRAADGTLSAASYDCWGR